MAPGTVIGPADRSDFIAAFTNTGTGNGVRGESSLGRGVYGTSGFGSASTAGVFGENTASGGTAVVGLALNTGSAGVAGVADRTGGTGVYGRGEKQGVFGESQNPLGTGVYGVSPSGTGVFGSSDSWVGVYGRSNTNGYAGFFSGKVGVTALGPAGSTSLCLNPLSVISTCSSSLRYKTDVRPFVGGLDLVSRLRPIAFTWKQDGARDLGLGAEDVAAVEPLLVTHNDQGQIEGVKYDRLSTVLINAIHQQQRQLARLRAANAALSARLRVVEQRVTKNGTGANPQ